MSLEASEKSPDEVLCKDDTSTNEVEGIDEDDSGADEVDFKDEGVAKVPPRVLGCWAKPWTQVCLSRRDVDRITRTVAEKSFIDVDIDLLLLLLGLVNGVIIYSQIYYDSVESFQYSI